MKNRGRLIVFEGIDGVGKTSLARSVSEDLRKRGLSIIEYSFPGNERGTLGDFVYKFHHNQFSEAKVSSAALQALHIAAHIDAIERVVLPALSAGKVVVLDRFWWSTIAYGAASGADSRIVDSLVAAEIAAWKGVIPDVAFLIRRKLIETAPNNDSRLLDAYQDLKRKERQTYPVEEIWNDDSMYDCRARTLAAIEALDLTRGNSVGVIVKKDVPRPTRAFDTYWRFAAERQRVYLKRIYREKLPWTSDRILQTYKFTNVYRASDRTSQYLIRNVIYEGSNDLCEVFFRILLFKLFNRIETWTYLIDSLGLLSYQEYSFERVDKVLSEAIDAGERVYSAAYIMPSGKTAFGFARKHRNNLKLLERMLDDDVPYRLAEMRNMEEAFKLLYSYPTLGPFLAYQFVTDINYSEITDFSEMDFVVPGPGALDGISKCFSDLGGYSEADLIRMVCDEQEKHFDRLELSFDDLWGRPLQLIDCQNLFCEISKYSRVAHPEIEGVSGRIRIKQKYSWTGELPLPWFPPKWGINERIKGQLYVP